MNGAKLVVEELTIAYEHIEVVHGISFQAPAAQITCLIGPNGAGKTSTLHGVLGLIRPSSGAVLFDGINLTGYHTPRIVRSGIGLVPQGRRVFSSLSVLDNLRMGTISRHCNWRNPDGLEEVFTLFPELNHLKNNLAGLLSGGEQQMLAIGRALMMNPRLLILDEPSMGLAPIIIDRIYEGLAALRSRGITVLLVEQNARLALEISDYALILVSGAIIESGQAKEIKKSQRVQDVYLGA